MRIVVIDNRSYLVFADRRAVITWIENFLDSCAYEYDVYAVKLYSIEGEDNAILL